MVKNSWPECHGFRVLEPPKTRRIEGLCSKSSHWCDVVFRKSRFQLWCHPRHLPEDQIPSSVVSNPRSSL
ncbi:hypothetical protein TNCV_3757971 [Trichonephila clavipes]|nr:hypothetical protein TNCV_3757971 [Trichonephila clavipes]